jgi:hypothetical protein
MLPSRIAEAIWARLTSLIGACSHQDESFVECPGGWTETRPCAFVTGTRISPGASLLLIGSRYANMRGRTVGMRESTLDVLDA